MKTTHVIGLFTNGHKSDKISNSLMIAGIPQQSFSSQIIDGNVLAVNVSVKDHYESKMVHNIFDFYRVSKIYETDSMNTSDIKSFIAAHSKAEIHESQKIRLRKPHDGINSEVHFG